MTDISKGFILSLYAETSIHAGTGQSLGVIDLPIQREIHTGWPCVYGSGLKGSLRTSGKDQAWCKEVFGCEDQTYSGALSVVDARLLLLPVRSLTSHFKWVTCPAILKRLKMDCQRIGISLDFSKMPIVEKEKAVVSHVSKTEETLYLEELRFELKQENLDVLISNVVKIIGDESIESALKEQLVIVHDDIFKYLSEYATPVIPHIAIDSDTKTTKGNALWYEESLPPDTILYSALLMQPSRKPKGSVELLQDFKGFIEKKRYLQIGGNETTGMGWCRLHLMEGEGK